MLAIPNVSEGRDAAIVRALNETVEARGARVLDVHSDRVHNRSVLTVAGSARSMIDAMKSLAVAAVAAIDLSKHDGVHPCLGALDVCPLVSLDDEIDDVIAVARQVALEIGAAGLPVYVYGEAAFRPDGRELPFLRRGGLEALMARCAAGFEPDEGPAQIDPRRGVVCVGARRPLIAFNVNLAADAEVAETIAARIRSSVGGLPCVRALGFRMPSGTQVSMNLIEPEKTGIDDAFDTVEAEAKSFGAEVISTELIGLIPERFLPNPDAKAARLLVEPGRSLEAALKR